MGRTNACKAQQKRERNTKKGTSAKANSQLKANQACMTLRCEVCMQTFMSVTSRVSLKEHSENKHPKNTFDQCFPNYVEIIE